MRHREQHPARIKAQCKSALLMLAMSCIKHGQRERILKHCRRLIKCHAMLARIGERLDAVPFEIIKGLFAHRTTGPRARAA